MDAGLKRRASQPKISNPKSKIEMPAIIVLTAPSGAGKTTIARRVMKALPEVRFSVSATTRPRRPQEKDGIDYHFLSRDTFREYIRQDKLLEFEEVYPGQFYGTLRFDVERSSPAQPVLLDVDIRGASTINDLYGSDALILFISPPSLDVLAERLRDRNTESKDTLRQRLERAEMEMAFAERCDAVIVNDDLEEAVAETLERIREFLDVKKQNA